MNDAAAALEQRIHAGIPLSRSVQFHIAELDGQSIRVAAPLAPNINVHGTGFAGSLYALGILTAWAMAAITKIRWAMARIRVRSGAPFCGWMWKRKMVAPPIVPI